MIQRVAEALVAMAGFPATLVLRDTLVLDRWRWLRPRLPAVGASRPAVLDAGCAAGAFAIGAARLGCEVLGLDYARECVDKAAARARRLGADRARFEVADVRRLDERRDLAGRFDAVICCENIEHILDDAKLVRDLAGCLKPGGRLLLTTPFAGYRAITAGDDGPCSTVEDGGHVRRGYTPERLTELCLAAGFARVEISYCSGFLSQKMTAVYRVLGAVHPALGWAAILPFRVLPPLLDGPLTRILGWPWFSTCAEAVRA